MHIFSFFIIYEYFTMDEQLHGSQFNDQPLDLSAGNNSDISTGCEEKVSDINGSSNISDSNGRLDNVESRIRGAVRKRVGIDVDLTGHGRYGPTPPKFTKFTIGCDSASSSEVLHFHPYEILYFM